MFEDTWKTWVILALAFVGGCFEVFKHMPVKESLSWEAENLHYGADGKPYAVHVLPRTTFGQPRPKAMHVAGDRILQDELRKFVSATKPQQTETAHKNAPAAAKKKKEHNPDEWELVMDPVTGKQKWVKKKKDAKKDQPADPVKATEVAKTPTNLDNNTPAAIGAAVDDAANTGSLPAPSPSHNNPFSSLQDWEHLLLVKADAAETARFIQDYKNHTVSPDIFYKITQMMIADQRPEMKQLGVMCAGATPSLTSFQILASVAKSGSTDLQAKANGFLQQYTDLSNLTVLRSVLQASDTGNAALAAGLVDTAAQKNLKSASGGPSTLSAGTTARFQQFLPILNTLSHSSDATLASRAQQTFNDLTGLLPASTGGSIASTP